MTAYPTISPQTLYCRQSGLKDSQPEGARKMSSEGVDSEEENAPTEATVEDLVKGLPQASDQINKIIDSFLSSVPMKYGFESIRY